MLPGAYNSKEEDCPFANAEEVAAVDYRHADATVLNGDAEAVNDGADGGNAYDDAPNRNRTDPSPNK